MAHASTRRGFLQATGIAGSLGLAGRLRAETFAKQEYEMNLATAYKLGTTEHYPVMQQGFKENLEEESDGQITVNLQPNAVLGAGTELAKKVQNGTVEAAQFSFSNFSPYASAVDLVNLPYFAGTNQQFVNLVTSEVWQTEVHAKVRQNGFEPLFYLVIDPRAIALRKGIDEPIKRTEDMEGLKHRIPGSDILKQAWEMTGANPTPIAWGETPSAMQEGVADSLHTAPQAYVAFGFTDLLSHITLINMVEDAQVYAMNKSWYDNLSDDLRQAVDRASEKTFQQNLEQVPKSRENSYAVLEDAGVEFHELSDSELSAWKETVGFQRSEWESYKQELAGDMETFRQLEEATQRESDYTVN